MTEWDKTVYKEAGILAGCIFFAMVAVVYFGDDTEAFWKFVAWLFVLVGVTRLGLWFLK